MYDSNSFITGLLFGMEALHQDVSTSETDTGDANGSGPLNPNAYDRTSFLSGMLIGMNILRQNIGTKEAGIGTVNDVWTEYSRTYDFTVVNSTGNDVYEIDVETGELILSKDTPLDDDEIIYD